MEKKHKYAQFGLLFSLCDEKKVDALEIDEEKANNGHCIVCHKKIGNKPLCICLLCCLKLMVTS